MRESALKDSHYEPMPVLAGDAHHISIRDDVRRTIRKYKFQPSLTHYTSISSIYQLYLQDTSILDTPSEHERFRSALGRVLRPPASSGEYARSFSVPDLLRWDGRISLVSAACEDGGVERAAFAKHVKRETGKLCREKAAQSVDVAKLRRARRARKLAREAQGTEIEQRQVLSFRYVDEFVGLNCAEDLMRLKVFPNGKELAESMSAYCTVRHYLHKHDARHEVTNGMLCFRDKNVVLVAVGDGVTPRTATLFAFRSAWRCVSIDPMMRRGQWDEVSNLQTITERVQDVSVDIGKEEKVVVVMWHCHTTLKDALGCLTFGGRKYNVEDDVKWKELRKRVAVVSCSCCSFESVQREMLDGSEADEEFEDEGVPGLMRTVRVWKMVE